MVEVAIKETQIDVNYRHGMEYRYGWLFGEERRGDGFCPTWWLDGSRQRVNGRGPFGTLGAPPACLHSRVVDGLLHSSLKPAAYARNIEV